eukprot:TRINITY_DN5135_c0_g2_i1.p1 TRINITY_DN5135_c0_g2~~TRINITY_DN5135_c0_g2_i1.p1  ORF type:complete len:258 (+),score=55.05 TRINITY_DN5135_c0_g2_i1:87-776(+)
MSRKVSSSDVDRVIAEIEAQEADLDAVSQHLQARMDRLTQKTTAPVTSTSAPADDPYILNLERRLKNLQQPITPSTNTPSALTMEERLQKLKGTTQRSDGAPRQTVDEMQLRLATLKGDDPALAIRRPDLDQPPLSEEEQIAQILSEVHDEYELQRKYGLDNETALDDDNTQPSHAKKAARQKLQQSSNPKKHESSDQDERSSASDSSDSEDTNTTKKRNAQKKECTVQ